MPTLQELRGRFHSVPAATLVGVLIAWMVAPGGAFGQQAPPPTTPGAAAAPAAEGAAPESEKLTAEQLDSLVAPIALFSDDLLAQCLVASTYPIDIVAAQQWLDKHKDLKGDALSTEAMKQPWDPSIQALVSIPDALKKLSENITWTKDLGDAFLEQQSEVMEAVQRMRGKAKDTGKLESTEQLKVETKTVESKQVIVIEQSSPDVVYVPSYSPTVVYGAPPPYYPYPPMYYPPYYPGAAFMSFGIGVAVGIGISGGWGCGWGSNNTININNNNNYNRNSNRQNNVNRSGNSNWQHNASQRGGAPYKDKATANKYGGQTRGDQSRSRSDAGNRANASSRSGGAGDRGGAGAGSRGGASAGSMSSGSRAGGGRDVSPSSRGGGGGGGGSSAFGGSSSGSRARSSSSRGSSSMGSRGGGGGSRGGGGGRRR